MEYKFKGTPGPWHAIEYSGFFDIHDQPFYNAKRLTSYDEDVFEGSAVSEKRAKANAEKMAAVASEHYGDKWLKPEDGLPEKGRHIECYYVREGVVYEGHYGYDSQMTCWFYNSNDGTYPHTQISHYILKQKPQPPQQ